MRAKYYASTLGENTTSEEKSEQRNIQHLMTSVEEVNDWPNRSLASVYRIRYLHQALRQIREASQTIDLAQEQTQQAYQITAK